METTSQGALKIKIIFIWIILLALTGCGRDNTAPSIPENPASDFEYRAIPGGVEITNYIGSAIRVRIPEQIEGIDVIQIGRFAFEKKGLAVVYVPNSVIHIEVGAFRNNPGLTRVTLSNNLTQISMSLFSGCTGLTDVVIPDGVTHILPYAFNECAGLITIHIPDSVTHMDVGAFLRCTGLTRITIPQNIVYIDISAFLGCDTLSAAFNNVSYQAISDGYEYNLPDAFYDAVNKR
jgi:hypothetical protein